MMKIILEVENTYKKITYIQIFISPVFFPF